MQCTSSTFNISTAGEFPNGHLSLSDDVRYSEASFMDTFIMNRMRSTLRASLASFPIEPKPFTPLTTIIQCPGGEHLVSKLYRSCSATIPCTDIKIRLQWEADLGHPITDKQWAKSCAVTHSVSLNSRHKLLHFKFLRRIYATPEKQHQIDPSRPHNCPKCGAPHADFAHLSWVCHKLQKFWIEVYSTIGEMMDLTLTPTRGCPAGLCS